MKNFADLFSKPEFDKKYSKLKEEIGEYLDDKEYDLGDLQVADLLSVTIGKEIIVNISDKCPNDIKNIVYDFIKKGAERDLPENDVEDLDSLN